MKKSLLALAVLGAFATGAQAQTNVSIGGVVQANIKSYKASGATTPRVTSRETRIDDDYTSRFWLTGTEDLGGGLSALFYLENRLNTDASSTFGVANGLGNGDTFVGLKGGFGQVTLGKHSWMGPAGLTTEAIAANGSLTAMPSSMWATTSIMNQTGRGTIAGVSLASADYLDGASRRTNSITYRTPAFSGFSGVLGYSTNPVGNEGNVPGTTNYSSGGELFLQGSYNNGPLSVNLAFRDYKVEGSATAEDQQLRLYGFYKISAFKVGLIVDRAEREAAVGGVVGEVKRTAWAIPVSYTFGNSSVLFTFAKAGDLSGAAANGAGSGTGAKLYTLGFDHALSKRTNVGVYYSRLDNERNALYQPHLAGISSATGSALTAGENASTFGLGVKHTF